MVQIGNHVGESDEAHDAWKVAVHGDVHAGIQDESRRGGVGYRTEDDHRCRRVGIRPAEARDFSRPAPFSLEGMRIGERREIIPVVSTQAWPAHELGAFVQINMMLAEILA